MGKGKRLFAGLGSVLGELGRQLVTSGEPYLQLYPLPPRACADPDDLARELDADGLRGENTPLILDESMEET
jgi:hypothetical protein